MEKAIVVADDSAIIQNIINHALSGELTVLKAKNGQEAIDIVASNNKYDMIGVLLDLNMPEYNGFTTLDYFKDNRLFRKIPVAVISGDDTKDTIQKAFTYDIVDMLNKPFSHDNIKIIVNKMCEFKNI